MPVFVLCVWHCSKGAVSLSCCVSNLLPPQGMWVRWCPHHPHHHPDHHPLQSHLVQLKEEMFHCCGAAPPPQVQYPCAADSSPRFHGLLLLLTLFFGENGLDWLGGRMSRPSWWRKCQGGARGEAQSPEGMEGAALAAPGGLAGRRGCDLPVPPQEPPPSTPGAFGALFGSLLWEGWSSLERGPAVHAAKAQSAENIPNSSPSHCLYLQGADGSLRGEKETWEPWLCLELFFIHHRELSRETGPQETGQSRMQWMESLGQMMEVHLQSLEQTGPASIPNEGQDPSPLPLAAGAVKTNHQPLPLCIFLF